MPSYQVKCHACGQVSERRLTFSEYDQVKAESLKLVCTTCGEQSVALEFSPPSNLGFILKEGESGGWASKSLKENAYRSRRSKTMERKQRDHVKTPKLVPNYKGEEVGSWKEAQEVARQEKGDLSASTYDPLVKGV